MNENQQPKDLIKRIMEKLNIAYIKDNLGTVLPLAGGVVGFIGLVIIYIMFFGGGSVNIEDFIADNASVAKAERRACAIKHFGSPDQEMYGMFMMYKDRGFAVNNGGSEFLYFYGTGSTVVSAGVFKEFSGTIVGDIRINEPFQKVVELLKKNEQEGIISKLQVYRVSAYCLFQKNNRKYRIIIKSKNGKIDVASIRLLR